MSTTKPQNKQTTPTTLDTLPRSQKPFIYHSAYSLKPRHTITFAPQGRTKQSFKSECDINIIMSRYMQTGSIEHVNRLLPQYQDLESIDYQDAMLIVAESRSLFQELPSDIRAKFHNDPGQFLDFMHDPENKQEMAEMGLLTPEAASLLNQATPPAPPPTPAQPTPAPATPQTPPAPTEPKAP